MTRTERRIIAILAFVVVLSALVPVSAFLYRFLAESGAPDLSNGPVALAPALATPDATRLAALDDLKWVQYAVSDQGFAISIPSTWRRLPVNSPDLDAMVGTARQQNPELAGFMDAHASNLLQEGIRFWAYDSDTASQASSRPTTLTVLKRELPDPVSLDTYAQTNITQLSELQTRVGALRAESVALNGLPAARFEYTIGFVRPDGGSSLSAITQFLLVQGNDAFVIGFATSPESYEHYRPLLGRIAASFRFVAAPP